MNSPNRQPLQDLIIHINECHRTFIKLGKEIGSVRRNGNSFWGILKLLDETGPMTVPTIAKVQKLSRQRVQVIVDDYIDEGFLKFERNPHHKRSKLVSLTTEGLHTLQTQSDQIQKCLSAIEEEMNIADIEQCSRLLGQLQEKSSELLAGLPR